MSFTIKWRIWICGVFIFFNNFSHVFMDKKMGNEVEGDSLGDEFKGYVFKVAGGNDKEGFPMK